MSTSVQQRREQRGRWLALAAGVGVLGLWEAMSRLAFVSSAVLPPPTTVVRALYVALTEDDLLSHVGITLGRLVTGVALGGTAGLLTGLAMGWSRRLRGFADPFVSVVHPVPKLALLPLLMVFFGLGEAPKSGHCRHVVLSNGANAMAGVRQISPVHFDVARSHGASRRQMLRRVVIPGSLPTVLTGVRLATNVALVTTVAVEMIAAQRGLGSQLWLSWQIMRVDLLFATVALIAFLGVLVNRGMRVLARRAAPWLSERELTI
jgi:NitT/TauT family transport system permease protein